MRTPDNLAACYRIDFDEWTSIVESYDRGVTPVPAHPVRAVEFALEAPLALKPDDILLVRAYAEGRKLLQRVYDGPPPPGGRIASSLAATAVDTPETYWLSVDLLRFDALVTCGWSAEERFDLPAPPHPVRWRLQLLAEEEPTNDGGRRTTRLTPLD